MKSTKVTGYSLNFAFSFPAGFSKSDRESYLNAAYLGDYFKPGFSIDKKFSSKAKAESAAKTHYKGKDNEGVGVEWFVQPEV